VTVVQCTFTQKQYTEYREWNIHNNKNKNYIKIKIYNNNNFRGKREIFPEKKGAQRILHLHYSRF
jgi:hypothetical protein